MHDLLLNKRISARIVPLSSSSREIISHR